MKAVLYCRVSSKEQEDTGYSLDAQEALLKEYASKKGLTAVKVFRVSESASGAKVREVFSEMMALLTKREIHVLICEKTDRLTRSRRDAVIVDEWVRQSANHQVHFVKENFILTRDSRANEKFIWGIKVEVAQYYTNNLSEEVKKGQAEKIRQGGYPSRAPIGYRTIGEKGHKSHIFDEKTAPIVRKIFELYASGGYSMKALTEFAQKEGLRNANGRFLVKSKIESILKEPFYYGAIRWNGKLHDIRATHPPIISKEVFNRVQEIRSGKKAPSLTRRFFQFRKMLTCGECGGTITAEIKKGRYVYYHCNHYRNCLQEGNTQEGVIENQLFGVFKFFEGITSAEAEEIKAKIKQNHAQEMEYKEKTIQTLNERYSVLQRRLDNLYNDRLDEKISVAVWETKQKEITDEQTSLQDRLAQLKSEEAKYFEIWLNIIDLARRAREIYEKRSPEERRMLLNHIFSNLMLKDGQVISTLKKSTAAVARRVQERLDAERSLELGKSPAKQGDSRGAVPEINTLLRG